MVLAALPQDTIRLIKSTQVITTPTSIVKELVENSLDAAATTVSVKLEKFGFLRLEVRDNGTGIHEKDVELIAKPHFTSKISSFSDLSSLTSYGFRGEALSSLCAVANVTVTTKTKDGQMGYSYTFSHLGDVTLKKPAATPNGTTIIVSNLFKNVPVRHQYYSKSKHCKDVLKKLEDIMLGMALAAPNVHLTLTHDRVNIFQKNAAQDLNSVLMNIFPDTCKGFTSIKKSIENVTMEVYMPAKKSRVNSIYSRSSSDRLFILINKRLVKYKAIEKLSKLYFSQESQGCHGRYPIGLITLTVPPDSLDVNLEPNKTKVLLKDEDVLLEGLKEIFEDLYGPLEKTKSDHQSKTSDSTPRESCIDITCTYADVSQPQGSSGTLKYNEKENTGNPIESSFIDGHDDDLFHPFPPPKTHTDIAPAGKTKDNSLSLKHQKPTQFARIASQTTNSDANLIPVPKVVVGRGTEREISTNITIEGMEVRDQLGQGLNMQSDDDVGIKENRICSTPEKTQTALLPDMSLSTIHSSTESNNPVLESTEINLSKGMEIDIEATSVLNHSTPLFDMPDTSVLNLESKPVEIHAKEKTISEVRTTNSRSSQMHESFMGVDGIPVFKIAPISEPCISNNVSIIIEAAHRNVNKENINSSVSDCQKKSLTSNSDHENNIQNKVIDISLQQQQDPATTDHFRAVKNEDWSRGAIVENGQNIQTVQLLKPQNGTSLSSVVNKPDGKRQLSVSPRENQECNSTPKKVKLNSLGPASYDYVHSKAVKRPTSAFILFSRDIRLEVLVQHPGKDFAWVAKEMADRWKILDAETKKHYQAMAKEDSDRYQREIKKIKEQRGLNISLNTTPNNAVSNRASLDKYVAPHTPQLVKKEGKLVQQQPVVSKYPWKEHSKVYDITIDMIKDKMSKRNMSATQDDDIRLIGPLGSCGEWTCVKEGILCALNTSRLHETILCRNLFQSFKLPAPDAKDPIPFNESVIGANNWALLIRLKREKVVGQSMYVVTDRRLIMNGFRITLYPSSVNCSVLSHGEITGVSNNIGFYGINDLKEILSVLVCNPTATVGQTRPLKVQFWLKGETVRMIRAGPNMLSAVEVLEKLNAWKEIQTSLDTSNKATWEEGKCLHDKPIFIELHSLYDLPLSQSQTQSESQVHSQ